jgi:putative membrane protein
LAPFVTALPSSPPSWSTVFGDWTFGWSVVLVGVAAALYLAGVQRLVRRGRSWSLRRTASFLLGLVVVLLATASGLARYDTARFSLHVVQHLLLGMVAPILLVLGAPITLALQASRRPAQRRILRLLHGRSVRLLTHPLLVWIAFTSTLVVVYFTGLYELTLRNDAVHELVHLHFLVVGSLFAAYVVGIDPLPRSFGYGGRALFVAVVLPFHAFLGVALLGRHTVIAAEWYAHVAPGWVLHTALADQRTGAGILWAFGELFGLAALGIVFAQWMRHEEQLARRADARADAGDLSSPATPAARQTPTGSARWKTRPSGVASTWITSPSR